jgi:adenylate cyclase
MSEQKLEVGTRKLTAILSADVFGYSRLMSTDEESCFRRLTAYRETIFKLIRENHGRVANTAGDAVLAEFTSAKDAASCAIAIQKTLAESNSGVSPGRQMHFRIGLNLGDVYEQQGDLFGDGVNIAARIQSLADPGTVFLSASVFDQLANKSDIPVEYVGEFHVKNIAKPVKVYRISGAAIGNPQVASTVHYVAQEQDNSAKIVIGILPFDNLK